MSCTPGPARHVAPYLPNLPLHTTHTIFYQVANLQKLRDATRAWDHHSDGEGASASAASSGSGGGGAALLLLVPPPLDPLDALMPFLEVRFLYV